MHSASVAITFRSPSEQSSDRLSGGQKSSSVSTVETIIRAIEGTDIEVLSLRHGDVQIRVVQDAQLRPVVYEQQADPPADDKLRAISAPLTGIYYARPSPEQPQFVTEGGLVIKGQVVGLIETMKLFNEVIAEIEGEVRQVLVAEGDLVEANQPLMRIAVTEEPPA